MLKVNTFNDELEFETHEEIINYFNDEIMEFKNDYFFDGGIVITGDLINPIITINTFDNWQLYTR